MVEIQNRPRGTAIYLHLQKNPQALV